MFILSGHSKSHNHATINWGNIFRLPRYKGWNTVTFVETIILNYVNYHFLQDDCGITSIVASEITLISGNLFYNVTDHSVFFNILCVSCHALLQKLLNIQYWVQKDLNFLHVWFCNVPKLFYLAKSLNISEFKSIDKIE
jgi:hypothetical protein